MPHPRSPSAPGFLSPVATVIRESQLALPTITIFNYFLDWEPKTSSFLLLILIKVSSQKNETFLQFYIQTLLYMTLQRFRRRKRLVGSPVKIWFGSRVFLSIFLIDIRNLAVKKEAEERGNSLGNLVNFFQWVINRGTDAIRPQPPSLSPSAAAQRRSGRSKHSTPLPIHRFLVLCTLGDINSSLIKSMNI